MGLNSALSSSSLFYQPFPSSSPSSSSSHSFPAHHSFLVTPNSLKLLMHKGSLSPAPILINVTKKSFSRFFAAASGDSTSHREFPTTACGNGAPLSSSSSAIDFLTLCHRLKFCPFHPFSSSRCIKIAIVHDIAEGTLRL
ncbi:hypothetical protein EJ110_NYTH06882 [Nymphaea thermarum]|nr:hypothetical protein EJ110_NYTH06882 [Nymphaea thermarum]